MHSFHAMGGLPEGHPLQAEAQIREAVTLLAESKVLRMIGARLRPECSHRPLPRRRWVAGIKPVSAPLQTLFSLGREKKLESLPHGILSEDLQCNDRAKRPLRPRNKALSSQS